MVVGFGLSVLLIGRLVFSDFSILDDHQIVSWAGIGLWPRISSTEIVRFGTSNRFRPLLFLTLSTESWIFGTRPAAYHFIQIIWFGVFLWSFAWASFRSIGIAAGLAVLFLVVNGPYWGNIWTHSLFASEQMASFGFGLIIFGYGLACSWFVAGCRGPLNEAALLVSVGTLICIGAKENFLPQMPLDVLLISIGLRKGAIDRSVLVACVMLIFLQLLICYGIIVPNMGRSTDIYGGDTRLSHRFATIFHPRRFFLRAALSWLGGGAAAAWAWIGHRKRNARETRKLTALSFFLLLCGTYVCWEQFFYNGMLPVGRRYDFPALLIDPILAGAFFYTLLLLRDRVGWMNRQFSAVSLRICFALLILPVAVASYDHDQLVFLTTAVRISNDHTAAMASDLQKSQVLTAQHPDWPIVVAPANPMDYESVVTFPLWLKYKQISNPASVLVNIAPREITSPFEQDLVDSMQDASKNGRPELYAAKNEAVQKAWDDGHCYVVEFDPRDTRCIVLPYHPTKYLPVD